MLRPLLPDLRSPIPTWIKQAINRPVQKFCFAWSVLIVSLLLSGCIQYDLGIQFDSPSQGKIVQHIQVEERLTSFNGVTTQQWLEAIEQRAHNLKGWVEQKSNRTLVVTIPFSDDGDLETKFNQFFGSPAKSHSPLTEQGNNLPKIASNLLLSRSNLLLIERNSLRYDLDLRSLGVLSTDGSLLLSPGALINLEFRLKTPWGARSVTSNAAITRAHSEGRDLVWQLVPGEQNRIEAVFWLPSPLGIGTLVIVLLVLVGTYVKYPQSFMGKSLLAPKAADSETGIAS
ncbi:MAG: DUF3153 domain-containing protein [Kovacikia sp.]